MNKKYAYLLGSMAVFAIPSSANANIGVPMIMIYAPSAWLVLLPIIAIEAMVGVCMFNLPQKECWKAAAVANVVTTIIGIPVTWSILPFIEFFLGGGGAYGINSLFKKIYSVTVQSPWLMEYGSELYWMIPLASVFLMIPMYLMSVCIESYLATTMIVNVDTAKIWKWMWKANAFSYLLIIFIISLSIPFSNFAIKSYLFIDPVINVFIEAVSIVARLFN